MNNISTHDQWASKAVKLQASPVIAKKQEKDIKSEVVAEKPQIMLDGRDATSCVSEKSKPNSDAFYQRLGNLSNSIKSLFNDYSATLNKVTAYKPKPGREIEKHSKLLAALKTQASIMDVYGKVMQNVKTSIGIAEEKIGSSNAAVLSEIRNDFSGVLLEAEKLAAKSSKRYKRISLLLSKQSSA